MVKWREHVPLRWVGFVSAWNRSSCVDVSLIQLLVPKGKFKIVAAGWKIIMEIIFIGNNRRYGSDLFVSGERGNNWSELEIWPSGLDRVRLLNLHSLLFLHHSFF